jgi:hypothetical protein
VFQKTRNPIHTPSRDSGSGWRHVGQSGKGGVRWFMLGDRRYVGEASEASGAGRPVGPMSSGAA